MKIKLTPEQMSAIEDRLIEEYNVDIETIRNIISDVTGIHKGSWVLNLETMEISKEEQ